MNLNDKIAVLVTRAVGTMHCAYLFAGLAIYGGIQSGFNVQWFSQTFLQLVLLSVILVGQNVQADSHRELHAKIDQQHHRIGGIEQLLGRHR